MTKILIENLPIHIAFNGLYENKDENSDKGIFVSGYFELNKNSNLTI